MVVLLLLLLLRVCMVSEPDVLGPVDRLVGRGRGWCQRTGDGDISYVSAGQIWMGGGVQLVGVRADGSHKVLLLLRLSMLVLVGMVGVVRVQLVAAHQVGGRNGHCCGRHGDSLVLVLVLVVVLLQVGVVGGAELGGRVEGVDQSVRGMQRVCLHGVMAAGLLLVMHLQLGRLLLARLALDQLLSDGLYPHLFLLLLHSNGAQGFHHAQTSARLLVKVEQGAHNFTCRTTALRQDHLGTAIGVHTTLDHAVHLANLLLAHWFGGINVTLVQHL